METINLSNSSKEFDPLLGREQALIEQYIGAVLSSEVLEVIDLRFRNTTARRDVLSYHGLFPKAINWPRIRKLNISHISLTQDELEKFCSGLGYMVEDIHLHNIDLRSGSWAGALDMLRERIRKKDQYMRHGDCYKSTGREFGKENENVLGVGVTKNSLRVKVTEYCESSNGLCWDTKTLYVV